SSEGGGGLRFEERLRERQPSVASNTQPRDGDQADPRNEPPGLEHFGKPHCGKEPGPRTLGIRLCGRGEPSPEAGGEFSRVPMVPLMSQLRHRQMTLAVALAFYVLFLTAAFALAARKPENTEGPAGQLSKAPSWARALPNPYEGQADAAAAGRKLFERHCAAC